MKITKYVHSCLLVEMPAPINRTALFDPGMMSEAALDVSQLEFLDDIFITHEHGDHYSPKLLEQLTAKFPNVRITAPVAVVAKLKEQGITASSQAPDGAVFFVSPHENVVPVFPQPDQIGIHYLDTLTHPGDSHSFTETKAILALPVTAPWGSNVKAVNLALELKPRFILPIHDWHWSDDARAMSYAAMKDLFAKNNITFFELETGKPVVIDA